MSKILSAKNLKKNYSQKNVVNNIDINLKKGEIVGLLGPNGAGKTTTFYMITGMIRPSSGTILLDDIDITNLPMYKRARMGIGYLAQEPSIFGKLTVENNLKIVLETVLPKDIDQNNLIDELLDQFNINHLRNSLGSSLSGGERRRVEICRTLALNPDFVLLDEPFAGVDPIAVEDIQQMIMSLKEKNIGVLITDHNVRETLSITDRSYLLYSGEILKSGNAEFEDNEICFMGDDIIDIPILEKVGFAVSVPNAPEYIASYAHYITKSSGGKGAVREVIDMLIASRGDFEQLLDELLSELR